MNRIIRAVVYVLLLILGLSLTPARLWHTSFNIAVIGLAAVLLVQLRTTRNRVDEALAWVALWAVCAVLGAPFVPAFRALGELAVGAR